MFKWCFILIAWFPYFCVCNEENSPWNTYKKDFRKVYESTEDEENAKAAFKENSFRIYLHNNRYENNDISYSLKINQFTDMRLEKIRNLFPANEPLTAINTTSIPTEIPPKSFDYSVEGYSKSVQDQGIDCSSGWIYASAIALQIFKEFQAKNQTFPPGNITARRNILQRIGSGEELCKTYTPKILFDFLIKLSQNESDTLGHLKLSQYSILKDIHEEDLKKIISFNSPVIVEINPNSFDFLHYSEGIFVQKQSSTAGSHFMTIVGYGPDTMGKTIWKLQNSFGKQWGQGGFMRLASLSLKDVFKAAIYPTA